MLVETTTLRPKAPLAFLGGADSKILCCRFGGSVEYSGMVLRSPTSLPRLDTSLWMRRQDSSISYRGDAKLTAEERTEPHLLSREEEQHVSFHLLAQVDLDDGPDGGLKVVSLRLRCEEDLHRVCASRYTLWDGGGGCGHRGRGHKREVYQERSVVEVGLKLSSVQGGAHYDDLQVLPLLHHLHTHTHTHTTREAQLLHWSLRPPL